MQLIPAIDLIEGRCVRLKQGSFSEKRSYAEDPLDVAKRVEDAGLSRLHLVDLDGARQGKIINYRVLERICSKTALQVDFGGGVKTDRDLEIVYECGAAQAVAGSVAVKEPERFAAWVARYGPERLVLAADVRGAKVQIAGWQEESDLWLWDLLEKQREKGAQYVLCTAIERDGMLNGPDIDLYKECRDKFPEVKFIASGGVSGMRDLEQLAKEQIWGVVIGKALFEGRITLAELKEFRS